MKLSSTNSRFAYEPSVQLKRSRFKVPIHSHKLTFNNGELIPYKAIEILPGDTISLDQSMVLRMSTPVKPVFDNVFVDVFAFFVPRRLTWKHWEEFMGANNNGPWDVSAPSYNLPHTKSPRKNHTYLSLNGGDGYWFKKWSLSGSSALDTPAQAWFNRLVTRGVLCYKSGANGYHVSPGDSYDNTKEYYILFRGWEVGSIAQYMGFPVGTGCDVDSGYFRSYTLIWNEFFRDQNYMSPCDTEFSNDSDSQGVSIKEVGTYPSLAVLGGKPLRVSRFHDYFSSVLPEPQYGDSVQIPFDGLAKVSSINDPSLIPDYSSQFYLYGTDQGGAYPVGTSHPLYVAGGNGRVTSLTSSTTGSVSGMFSSLGADVGSVACTINDLRNAFQVQKYLERSARYGRRYTEILLGQFGVINPDYRLQRPELLCWFRKPLQVTQVLQTSSTDSTSPQGNTAAYSLTVDRKNCFTKSFTEHGILLLLLATRTSRSYQQGLPRWASRRKKLDFYFPVFAHLGEQPILNKEIFCHYDPLNSSLYDYPDEVFGYNEAWAEYRYMQSQISGEFCSMAETPLDFWHYADYYEDDVYMSDEWLFEGPQNLDRTLAVTSAINHQFQCDIAFDVTMVRAMPTRSIPGLADHF